MFNNAYLLNITYLFRYLFKFILAKIQLICHVVNFNYAMYHNPRQSKIDDEDYYVFSKHNFLKNYYVTAWHLMFETSYKFYTYGQ